MIITLTPDDIIKRCLWTSYRRFVKNNEGIHLRDLPEVEIEEIVKENKLISLSEDDAYAIGLLKVIETDNLVHRFDKHMIDILNMKSTIFNGDVYISVRLIENELDGFKKRFPSYWKPATNYQTALSNLNEYLRKIEENLPSIQIFEFKVKDKTIRYFQSKDIKKLIEKST
jgi:hypothetical protein